MKDVSVNVEHIARVEGHGNVVVNVRNGEIKELRLEIVESPRFFEVMLQGRPWQEVPHIVARICGICAASHTLSSIRAVENAFGTVPSEQTVLLRKLLLHAETLQSHILHLYFLVAPDFFRADSVIPLASSHPEVVQRALRMKMLSNELCAVTGGRHIHPITPTPGGFTRLPSVAELVAMRAKLAEMEGDLLETLALYKTLPIPEFSRPTECVSLAHPDEYPLYEGEIACSSRPRLAPHEYLQLVHEFVVPHSAAKHVSGYKAPYLVGALARVNNNHAQLSPRAQAVLGELGLALPNANTFHNNTAQLIECVHCWEDAMRILDLLIERGITPEVPRVEPRAGHGFGALEAPRGILFHEYEFDKQGRIRRANCVIPTGQNLANCEADMRELVPLVLDRKPDDIRLAMEMLVRAYDPCISCATHLLDVEFVDE